MNPHKHRLDRHYKPGEEPHDEAAWQGGNFLESTEARSVTQHTPPLCPYCGATSVLIDSGKIYSRSYGWAWKCPTCVGVYVGCHRGTTRPLGRLADAELRAAKMEAHRFFDRLWKSGRMRRTDAYAWLAGALGISNAECHIGMFDVERCRRVVQIMRARNLSESI